MKRISFVGATLLLSFGLTTQAQEPSSGTSQKKVIEKVPIKPTSAASGQEMYQSYCAACHGKEGKGDGPAASALKPPPSDLSALAKGNNGKFPADHVTAVLRFGPSIPTHGSSDMPTWGHVLATSSVQRNDAMMVELRIQNLTKYVESLQAK
jgi:mono/diheme cytochrome c family protein